MNSQIYSKLERLISLKNNTFDRSKLRYRQSTQALIAKGDKILMFQGIDFPDDMWSFPGGGLNDNETAENTIARELKEEFPDNTFEIKKRSNIPLIFEWSDEMIQNDIKTKGNSYRGQYKTQFLVVLKEEDIVTYDKEEIKNIRWVDISDVIQIIPEDRREATKKALIEFELLDEEKDIFL